MNYKSIIAYLGQNKYRDYKNDNRFIINPVDPANRAKWDVEKMKPYIIDVSDDGEKIRIANQNYCVLSLFKSRGSEVVNFKIEKTKEPSSMMDTGNGGYVPIFDTKTGLITYVRAAWWDFEVLEDRIIKFLEENL